MVEAEELSLADEYRKRFGLPPSALPLEPEALAAQEAARAARYLPLGLSPDRVLWVDGPVGLSRAREALAGAEVVGLDVEWKAGAPGEEQEGEGEAEEAEEVAEEAARGGGGRRGWGRKAGREAASPASLLQVCLAVGLLRNGGSSVAQAERTVSRLSRCTAGPADQLYGSQALLFALGNATRR